MTDSENILVVDDEPFKLEILKDFLSDAHSDISFAASGGACLSPCPINPDLI